MDRPTKKIIIDPNSIEEDTFDELEECEREVVGVSGKAIAKDVPFTPSQTQTKSQSGISQKI